jgi:hypothetical protein
VVGDDGDAVGGIEGAKTRGGAKVAVGDDESVVAAREDPIGVLHRRIQAWRVTDEWFGSVFEGEGRHVARFAEHDDVPRGARRHYAFGELARQGRDFADAAASESVLRDVEGLQGHYHDVTDHGDES